MRNLMWTGTVAVIVTASGVVAGQKQTPPAAVGMVMELADRARIRLVLNPTAVLDRILSFDANADNRISREELPERMESLVTRGDRNNDGVLAAEEIVPLIAHDPSPLRRRSFVVDPHGSATSLASIIADLKLPPNTRARALAILNGRPSDDPGNVDFKAEMRKLLNDEDYENYVAAAARLRTTTRSIRGNISGVVVGGRATPLR